MEDKERPQKLTQEAIAHLTPEQRAKLNLALLQTAAGFSGLIELISIFGIDERNALQRMALGIRELDHLRSELISEK